MAHLVSLAHSRLNDILYSGIGNLDDIIGKGDYILPISNRFLPQLVRGIPLYWSGVGQAGTVDRKYPMNFLSWSKLSFLSAIRGLSIFSLDSHC